MTSLDAVPLRRLDSRVRNLGESLVVAYRETIFELDEVASFVWRQVDGYRTIAQIGDLLAAEYGIDAGQAGLDVAEMLTPLAEHGLLTLRG